jgi:BolA protein
MASVQMIESALRARLVPAHLAVQDESAQHAGHAGHRPGGGTHFRAVVVAAAFEGKSRVERQRMVYELLAEPLRTGDIHALALVTRTPAEWAREQPGARSS